MKKYENQLRATKLRLCKAKLDLMVFELTQFAKAHVNAPHHSPTGYSFKVISPNLQAITGYLAGYGFSINGTAPVKRAEEWGTSSAWTYVKVNEETGVKETATVTYFEVSDYLEISIVIE